MWQTPWGLLREAEREKLSVSASPTDFDRWGVYKTNNEDEEKMYKKKEIEHSQSGLTGMKQIIEKFDGWKEDVFKVSQDNVLAIRTCETAGFTSDGSTIEEHSRSPLCWAVLIPGVWVTLPRDDARHWRMMTR
ncbi:hypothetical protein DV515_00007363 [Chloebia gouldiae]|uniref:Uncharacterized protein n=1 Tax=Chloebia gouldiae TaxID=44316 RepID=A0A3L8SHP2_CHLGU|nr:hypothetical protein DV515_00007363 [Chloebia gouldiae]